MRRLPARSERSPALLLVAAAVEVSLEVTPGSPGLGDIAGEVTQLGPAVMGHCFPC